MQVHVNKANNTASLFVSSDTERAKAYLVLYDAETETARCSCPHYRFRREECKHIKRAIGPMREALGAPEFHIQLHRQDGTFINEQKGHAYVSRLALDGLDVGDQVIIRRVK